MIPREKEKEVTWKAESPEDHSDVCKHCREQKEATVGPRVSGGESSAETAGEKGKLQVGSARKQKVSPSGRRDGASLKVG